MHGFGSKAASIPVACERRWKDWFDDRAASRNASLDCGGFTGLSALVQTVLKESPFSGHVFVFRGRRGDLIKMLWWDGDGLCLFAKRLERGRFIWPQTQSGTVSLTRAQLSMLLEGIDWRRPIRTQTPQLAV